MFVYERWVFVQVIIIPEANFGLISYRVISK